MMDTAPRFIACAHVELDVGGSVSVGFDRCSASLHVRGGGGGLIVTCLTADEARTIGEGLLRAARQLTDLRTAR